MPFCWTPTSANKERFALRGTAVGLAALFAILGSGEPSYYYSQ
jgi:hypothetical protein